MKKINFASPYIELPKKLTVRQNLEIFARLYGVSDTENSIDQIANDLDLKNLLIKRQENYLLDKKIVFLLQNL